MTLTLYSHPFSSYCQKVLMALYENGTPFEYRNLEDQDFSAQCKALWPIGKFPVLVDDGQTVAETSIIIEHLQLHHPGPARLIPEDPEAALEVRFMDRFFDLHVMNAMNVPVAEALRPDGRKEAGLAEAARLLDVAYAWLEERLKGRAWAAGDTLSMADCAAAPSLFYADWVHQIGGQFPTLRAYRSKLLAHPSFARCVEEARQYRSYFPLGAPDRD